MILKALLTGVLILTFCISHIFGQTKISSPGAYADRYYPNFDAGSTVTVKIDPAYFGHTPIGQPIQWSVENWSPELQAISGEGYHSGETEDLTVEILNVKVGHYVFMYSDFMVDDYCDYYFPFEVKELPFPKTRVTVNQDEGSCNTISIEVEFHGPPGCWITFQKFQDRINFLPDHLYFKISHERLADGGLRAILTSSKENGLDAGEYDITYIIPEDSVRRDERDVRNYAFSRDTVRIACCLPNPGPTATIITVPSSCTEKDGYVRIFPFTQSHNLGPEGPKFEFRPADEYRHSINVDTFGNVGPLLSGDYKYGLNLEQAARLGCDLPAQDLSLGRRNPFFGWPNTFYTCPGQAVGIIDAHIYGPVGATITEQPPLARNAIRLDLASAEKRPDATDADYHVYATNLPAGRYCWTLYDSVSGCDSRTCYTIEVRTPLDTIPAFYLGNDCGGGGAGVISVHAYPYIAYSIAWSDGLQEGNFYRKNLAVGKYSYDITEFCGQSWSQNVEIVDPLADLTLQLVPTCVPLSEESGIHDLTSTTVKAHTAMGKLWVRNAKNLKAGDHTVSIQLQSSGCKVWRTVHVPKREITLAYTEGCTGMDGSIFMSLDAPEAEKVVFYINDTLVPLARSLDGIFSGGRDGLVSRTYHLKLLVDGCTHQVSRTLSGAGGKDRVYKAYHKGDNLCEYKHTCHAAPMENSSFFEAPRRKQNPNRVPLIANCALEDYCGEHRVSEMRGQARVTTLGMWRMLYNAATQLDSSLLLDENTFEKYLDSDNWCRRLKYCPLTMRPIHYTEIGSDKNSQQPAIIEECIVQICSTQTYQLCDIDEYFLGGQSLDLSHLMALSTSSCKPALMTVSQLILWHDQLADVDGYVGSQLSSEALRLMKTYPLAELQKAHCDSVAFCLGTFECSEISYPIDPKKFGWIQIDTTAEAGDVLEDDNCIVRCQCQVAEYLTCAGCVHLQTLSHRVPICYPGNEIFTLVAQTGDINAFTKAVSGTTIDPLYAPHRFSSFVTQTDEKGALTLPGAIHKSPFISSLDTDPYGARISYSDYDGLLRLDVAMDVQSRSLAIQQLSAQQIDVEFWNDLSETTTHAITASVGVVEAHHHLATPKYFFVSLSAKGPVYLNEGLLYNAFRNGWASAMLVFNRHDGSLADLVELPFDASALQFHEVDDEVYLVEPLPENQSRLYLYKEGILLDQNWVVSGKVVRMQSDKSFLHILSQTLDQPTKQMWQVSSYDQASWSLEKLTDLHFAPEKNNRLLLEGLIDRSRSFIAAGSGLLTIDNQATQLSADSLYLITLENAGVTAVTSHVGVRPVAFYPSLVDDQLVTAYRVAGTLEGLIPSSIQGEQITTHSPHEQVIVRPVRLSPKPAANATYKAIAKLVLPQGVTLQPKPARAQTTITGLQSSVQYRLNLSAIDGGQVASTTFVASVDGRYTLSTASLPPGMYVVQLSAAGAEAPIALKLVVQ